MISFKNSRIIISVCIRSFSHKAKPLVTLDEEVRANIGDVFKPKKHPGRIKSPTITVPESIVKAIRNVCEDHSIKALVDDSAVLARHLRARLPPAEKQELKHTQKMLLAEVLNKTPPTEFKTEQDEERFKQSVTDKLKHKMRRAVYNWTAVKYNAYNSLLYLCGRFAQDYAVLVHIFSEINLRDGNFKPRSFFDFGSGTGTATWAANLYWKNHIFEYFNVDSSGDMNDLAQLLLQGGRGSKPVNLKGTFYRQFLPTNNVSYDLVVCAYTLFELPSRRSRLETVLNLWNKTAQYLVIVENGTNAGFKMINEVRDFILGIEDEANVGHVFSPCPHDTICPRFLTDDTPCNFEISYFSLPFGGHSALKKEFYSYVVLKKGKRDPNDPQWPRIVRPPLPRSRHVVCRMCTNRGKLQEVIFTKAKHGRYTYRIARSSEWGDRLPINIEEGTESCERDQESSDNET